MGAWFGSSGSLEAAGRECLADTRPGGYSSALSGGTSYFLFNNWIHKGFKSLSVSYFVAGPIPMTPTKTPVPIRLSEKNESPPGDFSPHYL